MEKNRIAITAILIIMCACVVMSIPVIEVPYTVKEPYTTTETYYEKEPYETTETYYETEAYTAHVSLSCIALDWRYYDDVWARITVKNTDNVGGKFWVTFRAVVDTKETYNFTTDRVYIMPGESHKFSHNFGTHSSDSGTHSSRCYYEVHRTTKEVTKCHDVAKERTVIKYHDVAKQRTVTKYKDVSKYKYISIFEYIIGRQK